MSKAAIIFHRLGPYHCARLEAASRVLPVLALELSGHTSEYAWSKIEDPGRFERVTLFADADSREASTQELQRRLSTALQIHSPDIIAIPGWSDKGALAALRWGLSQRVPAVLMSDSTSWDDRRRTWKEWIKRRIVAMCSAGFVAGQPHVDYLAALGMPRDRIFTGYDAVDNEYFARKADAARSQRSEVRGRCGLPERYFLASARFIEKKNLARLIHAYAHYRKLAPGPNSPACDLWHLVLLGDGPLKPDLCRLISDLSLRDFVVLPGFKQYPELPFYYGLAGALIHASTTEQWGLVVNEAMASGLPVLVSRRCGCAQDLVRPNVNGFTFDPFNVDEMANFMSKVATLPAVERSGMGAAGRELIADWGCDRFAQKLSAAVAMARQIGAGKADLWQRLLLQLLLHR